MKMTETLANWYSFERAHRELSNEYQHGRIWMVLKHLSGLFLYKISCSIERVNPVALKNSTLP